MNVYIIFENNEEEYEDYCDWIKEIYINKEKAEKRYIELIKTNYYIKDTRIRKARYDQNVGAYRLEKHMIIDEENK